jgi:uncharacterized protein
MSDNDSVTQPRAPDSVEVLRARLSSDLRTAMKTRDKTVIETLRCLLAVLDNAGAPDQTSAPVAVFGRSGDVPRRSLTRDELQELLRAEVASRTAAVIEYERFGRHQDAARLRAELILLNRYVAL